jgi:hypothetical protein
VWQQITKTAAVQDHQGWRTKSSRQRIRRPPTGDFLERAVAIALKILA